MLLNRLFWKISATLLGLFMLLGLAYAWISADTARNYAQEVNQQLYSDVAEHLVQETKPILNGQADTAALHHIMHSMMIINPSVEVYLLDTTGKIMDYVVPFNEVQLDKVNLAPVKQFIAQQGAEYTEGDDPKSKTKCNIFSAAPIKEEDKTIAYAYVILAGKEHREVSETMLGSYFLKSGAKIFGAALLASLLIALLAIYLITKNLQQIITAVRRFKEGDLNARASVQGDGDLRILSSTFNEMADTLAANIEELKSVENLRRELIANVSHDLRTPLAVMQGYVETLILKEDKISTEDRSKYLNVVLESSEKMGRMIKQLFEFSKLEAKQIQPQKEPFFLSELAQDVVQNYQVLAEKKNVQIHLEKPEKLPLVFADVSLVDRVLQNLMDNALKFTPEGGKITLELSEKQGMVEVRVQDTGPGIAQEEQSAIFERYHQSMDDVKIKKSGSGLGLAIVKKILELHDATIRVQSRLNEGAAFLFELPAYG